MINSAEILGLRVEGISPEPNMTNVNVNGNISVSFNEDLSVSTIVESVVVLLDTNYSFTGATPITDFTPYTIVTGSISYKNKVVIFTPETPFLENSRYIVYIKNNSITSILNKTMVISYASVFFTESIATLPKCIFTTPSFGSITDIVPTFTWADQSSKCYVFQISYQPTFEVLLYDVVIKGEVALRDINGNEVFDNAENECNPIATFSEGLYYARVKSINGMFSDSLQFFIKNLTKGVVNIEDTPENESIIELLNNGIEVIEMFPKDGQVQIDTEIQIIYIKVRGQLSVDDIDFKDCYVEGSLIDDDESDIDGITPHGNVEGTWSTVCDVLRNVTYIIFTPI